MYEKQPHAIAKNTRYHSNGGESTFTAGLQTAADELGLDDGIIALTKFWMRQALTIVDIWGCSIQAEDDRQEGMPPY